MTRLILVRHGETAWNDAQRFQGQTDVPLNARGWWQAERLAERLAHEALTAIYTSDLARARDTAHVIAHKVHQTIVCDPRLREANLGMLQGLAYAEVRRRWFRASDPLPCYFIDHAPPGVESLRQLQARVLRALDDIARRHHDATVLVVTHGACLRAVMCAWLGIELAAYSRFRFDAGSISEVVRTARGVNITRLNDTMHLCEA